MIYPVSNVSSATSCTVNRCAGSLTKLSYITADQPFDAAQTRLHVYFKVEKVVSPSLKKIVSLWK